MAEITEAQGTFETRADAGAGKAGLVKLWLEALNLAEKEEKKWREQAKDAVERYRDEQTRTGVRFNILYANIETMSANLYNSTPAPDVRRRYSDADPAGKIAGDILERGLIHAIDAYDFDRLMEKAVHDSQLVGRSIDRVRFVPRLLADEVVYEEVECEHVNWEDFRHGPAKQWKDVPWIAFRHRITRQQAIGLNAEIGAKINLDWSPVVDRTKTDEPEDVADIFKRATVWEIWDKEERKVLFIAVGHKEAPLREENDPLGLERFFPIPKPLMDIEDTNSLVPMVPYNMYKDQAEELDRITKRIHSLVNALRWRGIRPAQVNELDQLKDAEDGDLIPSESVDSFLTLVGGDMDKAIWFMPIDRLAQVIRELMLQREAIQQVIFQITGISDIMRGDTNPNETLGAQQIKSQFGSLRLQKRQREVQRYARDLLRLKSEIIAEKFSTDTLSVMTNITIPPQSTFDPQTGEGQVGWDKVLPILRTDALRSYRIDVETDSTIQADMVRIQNQMNTFIIGLGQFLQAAGPAVQSGAMPRDVAADLLGAFSRQFRLGKQAEDALDRLSEQARQPQPDPAAQQAQADMQAKQAELQEKQAEAQQKAALDAQKLALDAQRQEFEEQMRVEELELKREIETEKLLIERQKLITDVESDTGEGEMVKAALDREKHQMELDFKREQADLDREIRAGEGQDKLNFEREKLENSEGGQALKRIEELAEGIKTVAEEANAPKEITFTRKNGRIAGGKVNGKNFDVERKEGQLTGATIN